METQTETPTRKVPISPEVFKSLELRAKAEGLTPDECAERLLLRAMLPGFTSADCPYCKKTLRIPRVGPPITHEAYQQLIKDELLESKRVNKEAYLKSKRVNVPMDADLLAEAKKHDVNIEEATRKHFKDVKQSFPKKA